MGKLDGKVAVITGGNSGMGLATARLFVAEGARVVAADINDVNKRLGNLIGWLRAEKPDVVALQELKAADSEFPKAAIEKAGYGAVWRGQKTWNGAAILQIREDCMTASQ